MIERIKGPNLISGEKRKAQDRREQKKKKRKRESTPQIGQLEWLGKFMMVGGRAEKRREKKKMTT